MDAATAEPVEPRQRWRLVVARAADAPRQSQRDLTEAWVAALSSAGLPLAWSDGASRRAKISFGAPLPADMAASGELLDIVLTDRWPAWRLREALAHRLPDGWSLVESYDVWLAGPPLAGRVSAADYRVTLAAGEIPIGSLSEAAAALLQASQIRRRRSKGGAEVEYDLRPLIADIRLLGDPGPVLLVRARFDPALGTGRPEEVVAALSDHIGRSLAVESIVRERLLLDEDLTEDQPRAEHD